MDVLIEPPLGRWRLAEREAAGRGALIERVNERAERLGTAKLEPGRRIVASGHQAQLWHPGILAKDIAAVEAARQHDGQALHLLVDQDAHEALSLELPVITGEALRVRRLRLAHHAVDVPTGMQPPVDAERVAAELRGVGDGRLDGLIEAFTDLPPCPTLAEQIGLVVDRLRRGVAGAMPILTVQELALLEPFQRLVDRMVEDARRCVAAYNEAVRAVPEAGVAALTVERERVELPLWACRWGEPRGRVYADLADREPWLVDEAGNPIDRDKTKLLPRALLLSAAMRSFGCELFIHGRGGGLYDQATEHWWATWGGGSGRGGGADSLAPRAVVSADVRLDLDVPLAEAADRERALWWRHHVPYNVDRVLNVDGELVERKWGLIRAMPTERDRRRRREAFREIRRVNGELVRRHPELVEQAERDLARAEVGLANRRVAERRDWCFALYSVERLEELAEEIAGAGVRGAQGRSGGRRCG